MQPGDVHRATYILTEEGPANRIVAQDRVDDAGVSGDDVCGMSIVNINLGEMSEQTRESLLENDRSRATERKAHAADDFRGKRDNFATRSKARRYRPAPFSCE